MLRPKLIPPVSPTSPKKKDEVQQVESTREDLALGLQHEEQLTRPLDTERSQLPYDRPRRQNRYRRPLLIPSYPVSSSEANRPCG